MNSLLLRRVVLPVKHFFSAVASGLRNFRDNRLSEPVRFGLALSFVFYFAVAVVVAVVHGLGAVAAWVPAWYVGVLIVPPTVVLSFWVVIVPGSFVWNTFYGPEDNDNDNKNL